MSNIANAEFVTIPNSIREERPSKRGGIPTNPLYERLAQGETAFVPLGTRSAHSVRASAQARMKDRGFRLHSFQREWEGQAGVVMWAEKL